MLGKKNARNLFVVDWQHKTPDTITALFNKVDLPGYSWFFYDCLAKKYTNNSFLNRYVAYFLAAVYILKNKKKYDNIIIWQPMIGFLLLLLPRFYYTPKIIITTILYSPSRVSKSKLRLYFLKQALKKADALLYFSGAMAKNAKAAFPQYEKKIYATYLPILGEVKKEILPDIDILNKPNKGSVFSGGSSDRDFETVVNAFTRTDIPVTIVCTANYVFRNPDLLTPNFTIKKAITTAEYHALILSASVVVVALENEYSACGQLLFTYCMKNGIPIIATDCYGTRDYILNQHNGLLVPVNDHEAILAAYYRLSREIDFRAHLIDNAKIISAKMTFDNYLHKVDYIIKQIN